MRALFIYNPVSGQGNVTRELEQCVGRLIARGWDADLVPTQRRLEATEIARRATAVPYGLVVAVGGDGTVSEVANGLAGSDVVMGVIPTGTTNVWALQMGIPSLPPWHPRKVVNRVLADLEEMGWSRPANVPSWLSDAFGSLLTSEVRAVDMGAVDGRYFLLWCGVGYDARVAERVLPEDTRRLGVLAYLAPAFSVAIDYVAPRMLVELDDRQLEGDVLMVLAANAPLYGGVLHLAPLARLDDGLLDVSVYRGEGVGTTVRHLTAALAGRVGSEGLLEMAQVTRLSVASLPSQAVHADAEVCATTPVDISVVPRGLRVLVPREANPDLFVERPLGAVTALE
ncbi:MAG: diacylglycerol kinase family lipid kinase [Anaerolineae bacterium]|nr:diacylglycerol kinase family lipid kinase [Anaerolineae bacterium]